jgi:peptidoglycan/LPS O-acetylase OafA/YrhL
MCDFYNSTQRKPLHISISIILFTLGIYIGSYQGVGTTPTIWSNLDWLYHANKSFPYIIGASLILLATINTKGLQWFFSSKPIKFLGKISFSLYLIHVLVLGSLSCFIFKILFVKLDLNYLNSFLCSFILSFAFMLGCSYYVYKYVDKVAIRLSQIIYTKIHTLVGSLSGFWKQAKEDQG